MFNKEVQVKPKVQFGVFNGVARVIRMPDVGEW